MLFLNLLLKEEHVLTNKKTLLSLLMLLLFCATFVAHSGHYAQVELEAFPTGDQHDCYLCQQGINSPPKDIAIFSVTTGIFSGVNAKIFCVIFVLPAYISPPLRAPPQFL